MRWKLALVLVIALLAVGAWIASGPDDGTAVKVDNPDTATLGQMVAHLQKQEDMTVTRWAKAGEVEFILKPSATQGFPTAGLPAGLPTYSDEQPGANMLLWLSVSQGQVTVGVDIQSNELRKRNFRAGDTMVRVNHIDGTPAVSLLIRLP